MTDEERVLAELESIVNEAADKLHEEPVDTSPLVRTASGWELDLFDATEPYKEQLVDLCRAFATDVAPVVVHKLLHNPYQTEGDDIHEDVRTAAAEWEAKDHTPTLNSYLEATLDLPRLLEQPHLAVEDLPALNRATLVVRRLLHAAVADEAHLHAPTPAAALYHFLGMLHQGTSNALTLP